MIKSALVAATAAAGLMIGGAAFAGVLPNGPEPYTAPDPVYTPHPIHSSVTYNKDGKVVSRTADSGSMAAQPAKSD